MHLESPLGEKCASGVWSPSAVDSVLTAAATRPPSGCWRPSARAERLTGTRALAGVRVAFSRRSPPSLCLYVGYIIQNDKFCLDREDPLTILFFFPPCTESGVSLYLSFLLHSLPPLSFPPSLPPPTDVNASYRGLHYPQATRFFPPTLKSCVPKRIQSNVPSKFSDSFKNHLQLV